MWMGKAGGIGSQQSSPSFSFGIARAFDFKRNREYRLFYTSFDFEILGS